MKNHLKRATFQKWHFVAFAIALISLTSCVSVQIPFGPVPKADKALVNPPKSPYSAFLTNTADEAWISEKTGNTISYLSECKKSPEKVEDVALEIAQAIEHSKIIRSANGFIASRYSSELIVSGKVDAHKVKMAIAVFKSGDCTFSLTYGGLEEKFDEEIKHFEDFKTGFRVP